MRGLANQVIPVKTRAFFQVCDTTAVMRPHALVSIAYGGAVPGIHPSDS
jgi:hypothetical protein